MRISRELMAEWQAGYGRNRLSELIPERDYTGLNQQAAQLRVWLPEQAKQALIELGNLEEVSMTVYLTEFFVTYLYGYHELLRMKATRKGLFEPLQSTSNRRSCAMEVRNPPEPDLGKNIFALKIFMPSKLKADLQQWANEAGVPLGQFVRMIICQHLFGKEFAPKEYTVIGDLDFLYACTWEDNLIPDFKE